MQERQRENRKSRFFYICLSKCHDHLQEKDIIVADVEKMNVVAIERMSVVGIERMIGVIIIGIRVHATTILEVLRVIDILQTNIEAPRTILLTKIKLLPIRPQRQENEHIQPVKSLPRSLR